MDRQTNASADMADFTHWPVVVARMPAFHEGRSKHWLAALDAALARDEPFVIVADMEHYIADPYEFPEEKKAAALWMKRNRDRFERLCRGSIYAVEDSAARASLMESGRQQASAGGLRIEAAATIPEAISRARAMLK